MIISNAIGGLGNQMFQYAVGRALALERGCEFRLDVSGFANYGLHQGFELKRVFDVPVEMAGASDIRKVLGWQSSPWIRRITSRTGMSVLRGQAFVVEPHFEYWEDIVNVPQVCFLHGYWQSEKYFKKWAHEIRQDFSFKPPLANLNVQIAQRISEVNSISLHVRRGDYLNNPKALKLHGLCPMRYYQDAAAYLAQHVHNPNFFVFSDDATWVAENLRLNWPCQYIAHNGGADSFNDMRLMSLCQHHIVANSSFSWWGAWLNPNINKIVVAPKRWFAGSKNTKDLLPESWITL